MNFEIPPIPPIPPITGGIFSDSSEPNCWAHIDRLRAQHEIDLQGAKAIARANHFVWLKCHPHTGRWSAQPAAGWRWADATAMGESDYHRINVGSAAELGQAMGSAKLERVPGYGKSGE